MSEERCPLCATKGMQEKLVLFQVNLDEAAKLCSNPKCTYPIGCSLPMVERNHSLMNLKRRKRNTKSITGSSCQSSRASSPGSIAQTWSPLLSLAPPQKADTKSPYLPAIAPPPYVQKTRTIVPPVYLTNQPSYVQWENKDALCWLDVVMVLLVHCKWLRNALDLIKIKATMLHTLVNVYDTAQAQALKALQLGSTPNKMASLEPSIGSVPVKTGGRGGNYTSLSPPPLASDNSEQDFLKGLDTLDIDTDTTMDFCAFEDLLENEWNTQVETAIPASAQCLPTFPEAKPLIKSKSYSSEACSLLEAVREHIWQSLQSKLRCEKGKDDSPVFALPLMLSTEVEDLFTLHFTWQLKCTNCGHQHKNQLEKVLTTLPNVPKTFNMQAPCFIRDCFNCKSKNQKMNLIYGRLPKVLFMHFVQGLPNHLTFQQLRFVQAGMTYEVTGVIQFMNHPDHFVAWIRNPADNTWMKCDDLQQQLCKWSSQQPTWLMSQVHIVMWEQIHAEPELSIKKINTELKSSTLVKNRVFKVLSSPSISIPSESRAVTVTPKPLLPVNSVNNQMSDSSSIAKVLATNSSLVNKKSIQKTKNELKAMKAAAEKERFKVIQEKFLQIKKLDNQEQTTKNQDFVSNNEGTFQTKILTNQDQTTKTRDSDKKCVGPDFSNNRTSEVLPSIPLKRKCDPDDSFQVAKRLRGNTGKVTFQGYQSKLEKSKSTSSTNNRTNTGKISIINTLCWKDGASSKKSVSFSPQKTVKYMNLGANVPTCKLKTTSVKPVKSNSDLDDILGVGSPNEPIDIKEIESVKRELEAQLLAPSTVSSNQKQSSGGSAVAGKKVCCYRAKDLPKSYHLVLVNQFKKLGKVLDPNVYVNITQDDKNISMTLVNSISVK